MYSIEGRVSASQTDANGRMKPIAALDMMQDCSQFWMETEPAFTAFLRDNGMGMFILSRQADMVRMPAYGERVRAATWIFDCRGFYGYRNTALYGEDGAPCVLSWSIGAFVGRESGKMARLPQQVKDQLCLDEKLEMEYLDKRITLPKVMEAKLAPVPVRRGDIDMNGHMNNARYVEAALELLPDGFYAKRLRVEYRQAAGPGDLLYPVLGEADGQLYMVLGDAEGRPYTVMGFEA